MWQFLSGVQESFLHVLQNRVYLICVLLWDASSMRDFVNHSRPTARFGPRKQSYRQILYTPTMSRLLHVQNYSTYKYGFCMLLPCYA